MKNLKNSVWSQTETPVKCNHTVTHKAGGEQASCTEDGRERERECRWGGRRKSPAADPGNRCIMNIHDFGASGWNSCQREKQAARRRLVASHTHGHTHSWLSRCRGICLSALGYQWRCTTTKLCCLQHVAWMQLQWSQVNTILLQFPKSPLVVTVIQVQRGKKYHSTC